jgi:hypothetical protein
MRVAMECLHCASKIPVNGAKQSVKCDECLRSSPVRDIAEELASASLGQTHLGSKFTFNIDEDDSNPCCTQCDAKIPIDAFASHFGATVDIFCPACGASCPVYPVPGWLKSQLPNALQIFGGDPSAADELDALRVAEPEAPKPVAFSCPKCGAGLEVDAKAPRAMACQFCSANVYLPDSLWKLLHPRRVMACWVLSFTKPLVAR